MTFLFNDHMGERSEAGKFEADMSQPRRRKYIYTDHSAGDQVVFECIAEGISEADELYKQKTGRDAEKQSYVG